MLIWTCLQKNVIHTERLFVHVLNICLKDKNNSNVIDADIEIPYGDMIKNPLTVANLFNEHFCNVCKSVELNTNDSTQLKDVTNWKLYNVIFHI